MRGVAKFELEVAVRHDHDGYHDPTHWVKCRGPSKIPINHRPRIMMMDGSWMDADAALGFIEDGYESIGGLVSICSGVPL
jgi:hypothetical protein